MAPKKTKTKTQTPWGVILAVVAGLAAVVAHRYCDEAPKGEERFPPTRSPSQPAPRTARTVAAPAPKANRKTGAGPRLLKKSVRAARDRNRAAGAARGGVTRNQAGLYARRRPGRDPAGRRR